MEPSSKPTLHPAIRAYYDRGDEDARLAVRPGDPADRRLEFWRTQDVLRRALPAPPSRVLDVGGATGVHASWLLADGHDVELLDPVPLHVEQAGRRGITARLGDARQLPYADDSFDAVLLMGPLYHLPERADRIRALTEARRVARPGGLVAAATISRWAALHDGMLQGYLFEPERRPRTLRVTRSGHNDPRDGGDFTEAYLHDPAELPGEFAEAGLAAPGTYGLEGGAWLVDGMRERLDDPEARETVLQALRLVEREPSLLGVSAHLLSLTTAP